MGDHGQEVIAAVAKARIQERTRHRRVDKLLERLVAAWEGLQPDVDELQNSLVGVQELVDLAKREDLEGPAKRQPESEEFRARYFARTELLTKLVDAWNRVEGGSDMLEWRQSFVEVQELVGRVREELEDQTTDVAPRQRYAVLVVEPHKYLRRHIREALQENAPDDAPVLTCTLTANPAAVAGILEQNPHDVVLLASGFALGASTLLLRAIKQQYHDLPVLMLGVGVKREYLTHSLKNGASGYLPTEAIGDELVDAIRAIVAGETYTSRQMR